VVGALSDFIFILEPELDLLREYFRSRFGWHEEHVCCSCAQSCNCFALFGMHKVGGANRTSVDAFVFDCRRSGLDKTDKTSRGIAAVHDGCRKE
jgi:hypothetical protein